MTKEFEKRVLREGAVDTRKYRYVVVTCLPTVYRGEKIEIRRIPLSALDTTAAIFGSSESEWVCVKTLV